MTSDEFRAALGLVRLVESSMTAAAYFAAGLFISESLELVPLILPGVVIGVPLGAYILRHVRAETFRRWCMSFDAWIVAFGISMLLRTLHIVDSAAAFLVLGVVIAIDAWLLYRYFSTITESARGGRDFSPANQESSP